LDVVTDHHRTCVAVENKFAADVIRSTDQRAAYGQARELAAYRDLTGIGPRSALDVLADHHRARVAEDQKPATARTRPAEQRAAHGQAGELAAGGQFPGITPAAARHVVVDAHRAHIELAENQAAELARAAEERAADRHAGQAPGEDAATLISEAALDVVAD